MKNSWEFEGEVVRFKEYDEGRFSSNIMIRGCCEDGKSIVEFGCMIPKTVKAKGLKNYKNVICKGHFETWSHISASGNVKTQRSCVVDEITIKDAGFFMNLLNK